MDLAKEQKNIVEHKGNGDASGRLSSWDKPQAYEKETEEIKDQRKHWRPH